MHLCILGVLWCSVCFCSGHYVMVPINLTCPHCLQHFFFEYLFHLLYHWFIILHSKAVVPSLSNRLLYFHLRLYLWTVNTDCHLMFKMNWRNYYILWRVHDNPKTYLLTSGNKTSFACFCFHIWNPVSASC